MDTQDGEVRLHLVSQGLRHRKLVVAAITLVAFGAGFFLSTLQTVTYTATSTLLLQPLPGNPLSPDTLTTNASGLTIAMATEANLVDTPAVLASAEQVAAVPLAPSKSAVSASVPSNTQIVQISYKAGSPSKAQDGAQAISEAFLGARLARAQAFQLKNLASLNKQAQEAQTSLDDATTRARALGPNSLAAQQVQIYAGLLATIKDSISQNRSVSLNAGSIVNPPVEPHSPSGLPSWLMPVALGLTGLLAGVLLAIWLELRTDVVRTDLEPDVGGAPLLADLPAVATGSAFVVTRSEDDAAIEAYRRLRAGILATTRSPHVIAVTCLTPKRSSASVAVNLALLLEKVGYSVTVVDAAPRYRGTERLLGLSEQPGLGDVLSDPDSAYGRAQQVEGIRVLPVGTKPSATEIFAGRQFDCVVDALRQRSDYVLIVADHAATAAADAAASASDGVLLVLNDQLTTHAQITAATRRLDRLERPVIGAVSIQHSRRRDRHEQNVVTKTAQLTPQLDASRSVRDPEDPAKPEDLAKQEVLANRRSE